MKILIVEDNDRLRKSLVDYMEDEGFSVDSVGDGEQALYMGLAQDYDLILLDVMLPGLYGWDVLKALRKADKKMPIIMISACDQIENQLQSINMGADDYMTKPFEMNELVNRIRSMMKPEDGRRSDEVRVGAIVLDRASKKVSLNGLAVELDPRVYLLLEMLMLSPDPVVTKYSIIEKLFDPSDDSAAITIDAYIFMLRQKLGAHRIQSRGGMGYRVVPLDLDVAS